ncbi:MAG: SGNH/GDSL hydrolase family protein [Oscillospiraceae bacterium]|nr:SGNH/GDSL hydrolase family protein [Oscillospiraceae bacterium]
MMKKICLFGDSISKGVVIDTLHNRYTMTKKSFANIIASGQSALSISNYSMLGCTIDKGISLINRHMKDVEDCDVMVLEYGGNDSDHDWAAIAEHPEQEHLPKTPIDQFVKKYLNVISELRDMDKTVIMLNLPPIDPHKYFNWFSRGLNGENILRWLGGSEEHIYSFHESYNAQVCNIAAERDIRLIDIRSAFLALKNYSEYLCDDGIHPNERGHELIANVIAAKLPELVSSMSISVPATA